MKERIGQPAEHLPHWKQRRTEVPESFSTLCTKSMFIVRAERVILVFFNAALLNVAIIALSAYRQVIV